METMASPPQSPTPSWSSNATKPVDLDQIIKLDEIEKSPTKKWTNNLLDAKSAANLSYIDAYDTAENTYNAVLNFEINNTSPKIVPNNLINEMFNENKSHKKESLLKEENGKLRSCFVFYFK